MNIILSLAHPSLRYPPSVRLSLSLWSRIAEHRRRLKQIRLSGSVLLYLWLHWQQDLERRTWAWSCSESDGCVISDPSDSCSCQCDSSLRPPCTVTTPYSYLARHGTGASTNLSSSLGAACRWPARDSSCRNTVRTQQLPSAPDHYR